MTDLAQLPTPDFISRDPATITAELVMEWETLTGKTLYPAQAERLFIDVIAHRETLLRIAVQQAAQQNLLAFATGVMLDYLADFYGVDRLPGEVATTALTFTLATPRNTPTIIPAGTRASTEPFGGVQFATLSEATIASGSTSITVNASCTSEGGAANALAAGAVSHLIDSVGLAGVNVSNGQISGGADAESDDAFRARIRLAPEAFATTGSRLAYAFHAKSTSTLIADVAPIRGSNGHIYLYVMTADGSPSAALLDDVVTACSDERVRPLSDTVHALSAVERPYALSVEISPLLTGDAPALLAAAQAKLEVYINERALALGRDIVPSQITALLTQQGVWQVRVISPSQPIVIAAHERAVCTGITLTAGQAQYG